jgi:hypothetical protein
MNNTQQFFIDITLTQEAHNIAKKFASEQSNREKVKQVYLNTLAVFATHTFLQWMELETDLTAGDSWHSVIRRFNNVADLLIPNLGKLECRPILPGDTIINLPAEVTEDRIGYVGVQFNEQLQQAQILGFFPTLDPIDTPEQILISELEPIENLIDYLERLETGTEFLASDDQVALQVRERLNSESLTEIVAEFERIYRTYDQHEWRYAGGELLESYGLFAAIDFQDLAVKLLQKLESIWGNIHENKQPENTPELINENLESTVEQVHQPGINLTTDILPHDFVDFNEWLERPESDSQYNSYNFQSLESFLGKLKGNQIFRFASAPRSRNATTEDTLASITKVKEIQIGEYPLALIISYQIEDEQTRNIILRLYPNGENTYLPTGVQLLVLDEGNIFLEAQSRSADNWMQLEFSGEPRESFSIKIALNGNSFTCNFLI